MYIQLPREQPHIPYRSAIGVYWFWRSNSGSATVTVAAGSSATAYLLLIRFLQRALTTERFDLVIQPQRTMQRSVALMTATYEVMAIGFVALHNVATSMRTSSFTALKLGYPTVLPALYGEADDTEIFAEFLRQIAPQSQTFR